MYAPREPSEPNESVQTEFRGLCLRCRRAPSVCYCDQVRPIRTQLEIVILQHPKERRKAIGTGRMAHLCLENSRFVVDASFDRNPEVNALISDPANHCVVLFPGPCSIDIGAMSPGEVRAWIPAGKRLVVFLIDGTWPCAKKMLRESSRLSSLPQIRFTPGHKSEYRIRRQPGEFCWSTLEAIHEVIRILEPSADPSNLLEVFRAMVDRQARYTEV